MRDYRDLPFQLFQRHAKAQKTLLAS